MTGAQPSRGEVWLIDLNPTRGHEQAGVRPGLVVSTNLFNHGPAGLVVILPLTSRAKGIPLHVTSEPSEGGVQQRSFIKPEDVRSVATGRLIRRWGAVSSATMAVVEDRLRILLEL